MHFFLHHLNTSPSPLPLSLPSSSTLPPLPLPPYLPLSLPTLPSPSVLVSMAPLSQEVQSLSSCVPPHLGPAVAEMNSIWFKLWLYHKLGSGPPSLLLAKGNRLRKLPEFVKVGGSCSA